MMPHDFDDFDNRPLTAADHKLLAERLEADEPFAELDKLGFERSTPGWKTGPDWPDPLDDISCADCRRPVASLFMLRSAVWRALNHGSDTGLLCLVCANQRATHVLGRSLGAADFAPDAPCNADFLLCLELGRTHAA